MQTVRGWLTLPLALLIVLTGCMAVLSALVIEVQALSLIHISEPTRPY